LVSGRGMNREEYAAWVQAAWEREVLKNMPMAKAVRQLKADSRESRKALASARRSMVASQAATQRKLHQRQADIEREFRERREANDREFAERRWRVLMGQK